MTLEEFSKYLNIPENDLQTQQLFKLYDKVWM